MGGTMPESFAGASRSLGKSKPPLLYVRSVRTLNVRKYLVTCSRISSCPSPLMSSAAPCSFLPEARTAAPRRS
jgi:hypothetical protein